MTAAARVAPSNSIHSASAPAIDLPARFLAFALVDFLLMALTAPFALPLLLDGYYQSRLLVFVHLNTLGVVAAMIVGASYQLVPVVLQTPLASERIGRFSFWCLLAGVVAFLSGLLTGWLPALGTGGTLLVVGFTLYILVIVMTMRRAPFLDITGWHIAVSLVGLAGGMSLGLLLALNRGMDFLGSMTLQLLATHIVLMVGAWVAVLLVGIAYRLIGMFTLSEDRLHRTLAWYGLGVMTAGPWLLAAAFLFDLSMPWKLAGGALMLAGQAAFAVQMYRLYHGRRRRGIDVHIPFMVVAGACGLLAATLVVVGLILDLSLTSRLWVAAGWFGIAGLAETAIQGMFYKIATFLVWLKRYAPLAGRQKVPRLEDLYSRRMALVGFALWSTGLLLSAGALLFESAPLATLAGVAITIGIACFLTNVGRIAKHWRIRETQSVAVGTRPLGRAN